MHSIAGLGLESRATLIDNHLTNLEVSNVINNMHTMIVCLRGRLIAT